MHTKKELAEKINEAGITPLKSLGQNFLVNPKISEAIINKVKDHQPDQVVEVGPGLGALTVGFDTTQILLIELDKALVEYWKNKDFSIIHKDALKLKWEDILSSPNKVLMSNLPYSIAASLVIDLSEVKNTFKAMVLMFQKEVAERMTAKENTPDYGFPSVVAQSFWKIEKLIDAGPQDFYPVPHVGSRVLNFVRQKGPEQRQEFILFVKQAFSQRRKLLAKNLSEKYKADKIEKAFVENKIDSKVRAQELSVELFQKLFTNLKQDK